jgi:membrane protein DedA with SNARE-associated domain
VLEQTVFHWITQYGYAAIICLLMLGIVGLPVPDETLLTFSGYMVFKGRLSFLPTLGAAAFGSICGITLSYILGRTFGLYLIHRYGSYLHVTDATLQRTHRWLEHNGGWSLFFGYYVPGVRHLTAYVAGTSRMSLAIFSLFAYSGAVLWSSSFVAAGYFFGDQWSKRSHDVGGYQWLLVGVIALAAGIYFIARKYTRSKPGVAPIR